MCIADLSQIHVCTTNCTHDWKGARVVFAWKARTGSTFRAKRQKNRWEEAGRARSTCIALRYKHKQMYQILSIQSTTHGFKFWGALRHVWGGNIADYGDPYFRDILITQLSIILEKAAPLWLQRPPIRWLRQRRRWGWIGSLRKWRWDLALWLLVDRESLRPTWCTRRRHISLRIPFFVD